MRKTAIDLGISKLVHFTRFENLQGILANGLRPRRDLDSGDDAFLFNDGLRLDGCRDAVCLSIMFPNYKMFYSYRCQDYNQTWVVLRLRPEILWEKDCAFCVENAASTAVTCVPLPNRRGRNALLSLFQDHPHYPARATTHVPTNYPTHPQAEVIVFGNIEPRYITRVDIPQRFHPHQEFATIARRTAGCEFWYDDTLFNARCDYRHWPSNGIRL